MKRRRWDEMLWRLSGKLGATCSTTTTEGEVSAVKVRMEIAATVLRKVDGGRWPQSKSCATGQDEQYSLVVRMRLALRCLGRQRVRHMLCRQYSSTLPGHAMRMWG